MRQKIIVRSIQVIGIILLSCTYHSIKNMDELSYKGDQVIGLITKITDKELTYQFRHDKKVYQKSLAYKESLGSMKENSKIMISFLRDDPDTSQISSLLQGQHIVVYAFGILFGLLFTLLPMVISWIQNKRHLSSKNLRIAP